MELASGVEIGPYRIVSPLGAGGMGEVYRARDPRLERDVALKLLPAAGAADPDRLRRFQQEARAAGQLNHPNLLTVFDVGVDGERNYLVAELLEGESFTALLTRAPIFAARAVELAREIAEGLAAAHEGGVVHRDLKPANLFLTRHGTVKILDFGLAKLADRGDLHAAPTRAGTEVGVLVGTLAYMAPEQLRGGVVGPPADLFALGLVLYELLTGVHPFAGGTAAETVAAILTRAPAPLAGPAPGAGSGLERLVRRCLEKEPTKRFATARELARELGEIAARIRTPARRAAAGSGSRPRRIDSIAVLPFANASGDAGVDYLSDGLTESIIRSLAEIPRLRVLARSTVFRFQGRDLDPLAVGRELGVAAVLTGAVSVRGETMRVLTELVDTEHGTRLWGEQEDRALTDLATVESAIAGRLAEHLRGRGVKRPPAVRAGGPPQESAAYQAYLQGRFEANKWSPAGNRAAIEFYQRAIGADPRFALAHAALASSCLFLGNMRAIEPEGAFSRGKQAARRAIELDPGLAEAHSALAYLLRVADWNWAAAESSFRRAIELRPSLAAAHRGYAWLLSGLARHDEAIREAELAVELEPLAMIMHASLGEAYFFARRYPESIAHYRRAVALNPDMRGAHGSIARAYEVAGRSADAIREYEVLLTLDGGVNSDASVGLANVYATSGRPEVAREILADLEARRAERPVTAWGLASIHASLGELDAAFACLDRALRDREGALVWLKVHPRFDPLRGDSRFQELLVKLALS